ncbi:MAG: biopolymer transporter ExbD [Verrucomicrobia bacterium]|nr:biopolymer transporter ExbD [Verrucomicrobiota bacterium]MBU4289494.1 biopolymer transporter ExbD [Verrucomicrobiota bacterium]MBU4429651.1 biopolymer transporter ExbD [Verrucomicrobiota bacterium]MBU4496380.1 biopolymer transporter ExbD [Verrucomicrobiota bacterium]MCG2678769.1 biopolymer transporter ExbD [Kiritimatiellia bacterium]
MMTAPKNGKYRIMSEMNMIPFIDIALVLLIIFMVMTPFLIKSQIKINLPKAKTTDTPPPRQQTLTVQLDKQGVIFLDGKPVRADTFEERLRTMIGDPKEQSLMIEADKDVPFQHVVVVLDAAKRIGITKLGINVKQEKKGASAPAAK